MKFWDTSAIVPLLLAEPSSARLLEVLSADREIVVWWGTFIECVSALARLERAGEGTRESVHTALERLGQLSASWQEVEASDIVRESAARFLRTHPLRAADALQLAAAFVASDRRPTSLEFVTLDDRLRTAAQKEGFVVISA